VSTRRLLVLLLVLMVVGVPAAAMSVACLGNSCPPPVVPVKAPFCGLSQGLRTLVENGYLEGRSPEVFAATREAGAVTGTSAPGSSGAGLPATPWPSASSVSATQVPIAFYGAGVRRGASVPPGTQLDQIAPTVATMIGLRRPHPEVRSGKAVPGIVKTGSVRPSLILLIAWKNVGSADTSHAPSGLAALIRGGAGTLQGATGSLPVDSAAALTTIGTGGVPSDHGITGTLLRSDNGTLVSAWGKGAPLSVIASLGDDMWNQTRAKVALVESSTTDRGLVGGGWYLGEPATDIVHAGSASQATASVSHLIDSGLGLGPVPDLLGVALSGGVGKMDAATTKIVSQAEAATHGRTLVVVAGTGSTSGAPTGPGTLPAAGVMQQVERAVGAPDAVQAAVPGGLFLNDSVMTARSISGGRFVQALAGVKAPDGKQVMSQTWPAFSISFARYC
jgi:hypothetical protein